jgi:hypothetical protein
VTDGAVEFKKGSVLCLERTVRGGPWTVVWLVSPLLIGGED